VKAVFLRALEETVDKSAVLREAVHAPEDTVGRTRFEVETESFGQVPRSPFAYWVSDRVRGLFDKHPALHSGSVRVWSTNPLNDDFRFARAVWETPYTEVSISWMPWAKGGAFAPIYYDIHTLIRWSIERITYGGFLGTENRPLTRPASVQHFFRPGLTWPRRTQSGLSLRAMPAGCIFADKGPAAFVAGDSFQDLLVLLAIANSRAFRSLVDLQMAFGSYEVGVIQRTPVPATNGDTANALSGLARNAWSIKRSLDTRTENSHAFYIPALLQMDGENLSTRATDWSAHVSQSEAALAAIQAKIDDNCFDLYGIDGADRERIDQGFADATADIVNDNDDAEDTEAGDLDAAPLVASLLSWTVGIAFGRFDLRLATGKRSAPLEPEPFDPLPVCSPGMLTGKDGLPVDAPPQGYPIHFPRDGILVDDPGAPRDLVTACRQVFDPIFDDPADRWDEAAEILGDRATGLRSWLAQQLFEQHIKRYSKSRRKAPIYWQLATPSASYSVWLYYHRFTRDTLFRVLNDHVTPKLQHEERKLNSLRQEAGLSPSSAQRRDIDNQDSLVGELRAMRDEVARVAPLWNPNLNDGVILNFAPLWRLVPQHKTWQKECKSAWDKLRKGDYDWAHLAMHLWPERVVPKCAKDRSLAIAHGLEDVFWQEGADGKWQRREVSSETVEQLIAERTIPAVNSALDDLISAPAPTGGRRRRTRS
jgi:hypothetical protein